MGRADGVGDGKSDASLVRRLPGCYPATIGLFPHAPDFNTTMHEGTSGSRRERQSVSDRISGDSFTLSAPGSHISIEAVLATATRAVRARLSSLISGQLHRVLKEVFQKLSARDGSSWVPPRTHRDAKAESNALVRHFPVPPRPSPKTAISKLSLHFLIPMATDRRRRHLTLFLKVQLLRSLEYFTHPEHTS